MTYHSPIDDGVPVPDFVPDFAEDGDPLQAAAAMDEFDEAPAARRRFPRRVGIALAVALVALLATAVALALFRQQPRAPSAPRAPAPGRVVPAAELPTIDPVEYRDVTPSDARTINAAVPFSTAPNPAARPFLFAGTTDQRARAVDCLAAAMYYEAGDDAIGERAVGQVILNRLRHPAFPKTVCGVVFQGQERATGCQFTFTCDGAMARDVPTAGWERARKLADAALDGGVMAQVGYATHYHTDWVVPYWSASLDKITELHTHLFFRWTGWWGTPPAFRRDPDSAEPVIAKLAMLSPAHALPTAFGAGTTTALAGNEPLSDLPGTVQPSGNAPLRSVSARDAGTFLITLDRNVTADQLPALAQRTCGPRDYCKLLAWPAATGSPALLPLTGKQLAAMAFSYLRDTAARFEKPLWNCAIFKRTDPQQCMKTAPPARPAPPSPPPSAPPSLQPSGAFTPTGSVLTPQTVPGGAP